MDDQHLLQCQIGFKSWKCPVDACCKVLSTKHTLRNHLSSQHDIFSGNPPKRYKLYEVDENVPVPRSTQYFKKWKEQHEQQDDTIDLEPTVSCLNEEPEPVANFQSTPLENTCQPEALTDEDVHMIDADGNSCETDSLDNSDTFTDSDEYELETPENNSDLDPDDPPIYVLGDGHQFYASSLTKSQHTLAVSAFVARHTLSDVAMKDLLNMIQLFIPKNNIAETKITKVKELCGFDSNYLKHQLYCEICKKLLTTDLETCQTQGCKGATPEAKSTSYFVTSNLDVQMKEILERKGMWDSISSYKRRHESANISDLKSGQSYKLLQEPGGFLHETDNITFSLFTDGIPLFKSSGVSIWPLYLLINEIPIKERFLKKNMILWGVWQGSGKPKMTMFLTPFVKDMVSLYKDGIVITVGKKVVNVRSMLTVATMDLQARAMVLSMTHHNGENGCLYCLEPGEVVSSGKGHCRVYPYRTPPSPLRDERDARTSAAFARENGTRKDGFMGENVLMYLPYFKITESVVIDYMHGSLLGICKKLLELWFDAGFKQEPYNISKDIKSIDRLMKNIKPPYLIHRQPRPLTNNMHQWKASELRNWLLFYSLPCLKEFLPTVYLVHFSCLVEAIYLLLGEGITPADLNRADLLLKAFVRNMGSLYGERFLSLNIHNLLHLVQCVRNWGPLWCWSCFAFEAFNGEIKKSIHGTGNVCRQIYWTLQAQKKIQQNIPNVRDEDVSEFLERLMDSNRPPAGTDAYQCKVIGLSDVTSELPDNLQKVAGTSTKEHFQNASKIVRNGFIMYSSSCSKVKKQNSYTISLQQKLQDSVAFEVEKFVVHRATKHVYAIGKMMEAKGSILNNRVPHLQKLVYTRSSQKEKIVIGAENLGEPLVIIQNSTDVYGALFPNHVERD